jgi:hypothetical protein
LILLQKTRFWWCISRRPNGGWEDWFDHLKDYVLILWRLTDVLQAYAKEKMRGSKSLKLNRSTTTPPDKA